MKITIKHDFLKKLGRQTGGAVAGAAAPVKAAARSARTRTADGVSRFRLNRTIRDIQDEIDLEMQTIGELLYATHRGDPSDSDDIQKILEYVDSLYEELEGHRQQLEALEGRRL